MNEILNWCHRVTSETISQYVDEEYTNAACAFVCLCVCACVNSTCRWQARFKAPLVNFWNGVLTREHFSGSLKTISSLALRYNAACCVVILRLRNDLYCVEWGVKLYSSNHLRCNSSILVKHKKKQYIKIKLTNARVNFTDDVKQHTLIYVINVWNSCIL